MNANPSQPIPIRDHERRDISVKWIVGVFVFLFCFGIGLHFAMGGFFSLLKRAPSAPDAWEPLRRPAARPRFPMLQISPPLDLQAFQSREQTELDTYGWINRTNGIVRIPIERAMDLVLQEGLPTRK